MKGKKKKNAKRYLIPKWVPAQFKDTVSNIPCKKYMHGLMEVMAAEMRIQILSMGEKIVSAMQRGDVLPNNKIRVALEHLAKYWTDPIGHEKDILRIQNEVFNNFDIIL